jgi:hypothetical protein
MTRCELLSSTVVICNTDVCCLVTYLDELEASFKGLQNSRSVKRRSKYMIASQGEWMNV